MIDLFLTSDPNKYTVDCTTSLGNSDHVLVHTIFDYETSMAPINTTPVEKLVWFYQRARWGDMLAYFEEHDWSVCFSEDLDDTTTKITETIKSAMRRFIPNAIRKIKTKPRSWFSNTTKQAVIKKNRAYTKYIRDQSVQNRAHFVFLRNRCKSTINQEKYKFDEKIRQKIQENTQGSKAF